MPVAEKTQRNIQMYQFIKDKKGSYRDASRKWKKSVSTIHEIVSRYEKKLGK